MSNAEIFLLVWAGLATVLAVRYRESAKRFRVHQMCTAGLLAEVVMGEVEPVLKDGFWVVENEEMKLAFKKKGD